MTGSLETSTHDTAPGGELHRTRFTWLAYTMLGYYAYLQVSLGPAMPFLRAELGLTYAAGGFHATAFAAGMVLAGLRGDAIASRLTSRRVFWLGGAGMGAGALLLIAGLSPVVTVGAAFTMGLLGTLLLVMVQSTLVEAHPHQRSAALVEANIVAAFCASLAPALVGGLQQIGPGWRFALVIPVLYWAGAALLGRGISFPVVADTDVAAEREAASRPLPPVFWVYWLSVFLAVSLEWCMALWTADFLVAQGVDPAVAAASVTVFAGVGMLARVVSSRLVRRMESSRVLLGALALVLVGFPVFWLGGTLAVHLIGLAVVGFGIGSLFPLGLAAAVETVPDQPNRGSARVSLAAGLAILLSPQTLGVLADWTGIDGAFLIVPVLGALALGVTITANRMSRRKRKR